MNINVASVFDEPLVQWGLRGDPFLWSDIRTEFINDLIPFTEEQFKSKFNMVFKEKTGHSIDLGDEVIYVKKYANGGMSSGGISIEFWNKKAIPVLISRLKQLNQDNKH